MSNKQQIAPGNHRPGDGVCLCPSWTERADCPVHIDYGKRRLRRDHGRPRGYIEWQTIARFSLRHQIPGSVSWLDRPVSP